MNDLIVFNKTKIKVKIRTFSSKKKRKKADARFSYAIRSVGHFGCSEPRMLYVSR